MLLELKGVVNAIVNFRNIYIVICSTVNISKHLDDLINERLIMICNTTCLRHCMKQNHHHYHHYSLILVSGVD